MMIPRATVCGLSVSSPAPRRPGAFQRFAVTAVLALLLPVVASVLRAQGTAPNATAVGSITGRVSNAGTSAYLEGAVVGFMIRGISENLSMVTIDGEQGASASPLGGMKRAYEVDKISADFIESIEVVKSLTPDMDAGAIGGGAGPIGAPTMTICPGSSTRRIATRRSSTRRTGCRSSTVRKFSRRWPARRITLRATTPSTGA